MTTYRVYGKVSRRWKIALITDIHDIECTPILEMLKKNQPDFIAVAGDLVLGERVKHISVQADNNRVWLDYYPHALSFLRRVSSIAPTYFSYGNHDWMLSSADERMIANSGVKLLDNTYVKRDGLVIGGLSAANVTRYQRYLLRCHDEQTPRKKICDLYKRSALNRRNASVRREIPETAWLTDFEQEEGYKILLCHRPEYFALCEPFLQQRKIDLVLSGHTHGGQIRLFGRGLYATGQGFFPRYTAGLEQGEHGTMIICTGASNTVRIPRLFNPKEIVCVELFPQEDRQDRL